MQKVLKTDSFNECFKYRYFIDYDMLNDLYTLFTFIFFQQNLQRFKTIIVYHLKIPLISVTELVLFYLLMYFTW